MKPNQQLKYLNKGSAHTEACYKAIPKGVYQRLAKLTSMTEENENLTLDAIYPRHFKALEHAGLVEGIIPTLKEQKMKIEEMKKQSKKSESTKAKQKRDRKRTIFFCVGFNKIWNTTIHKVIKKLRNKHDLKWLRVSMSYHRFTNLREILQGDLSGKITQGVESLDLKNRDCNCTGNKGECNYDGICRRRVIVYEIKCKITGKSYIGCTQQNLKNRMQGHLNDVQKLHHKNIKSDSYAKHFANHLQNFKRLSPKFQRQHISCEVIWQGNPISAVKTFKTPHCILCNRERLEILKRSKKTPHLLINSCSEIFGGCRHNPLFHRYNNRNTSADDSKKDEKVKPRKVTAEV
jgi:hypothetical protein